MAVFGRRAHDTFLENCKEFLRLLQESAERLAEIFRELLLFGSFPEFGTGLSHWLQVQLHKCALKLWLCYPNHGTKIKTSCRS